MIKTILTIRFLQLIRISKEVGLLRGFFVIGILFLLGIALKSILQNPQSMPVVVTAYSLMVFIIHVNRKDKYFIYHIFPKDYLVYSSEYLILVLPISIVYAWQKDLLGAIIPIISVFLISLIRKGGMQIQLSGILQFLINPLTAGKKSGINISTNFINPLSFEWKSGMRQYIFILLPLYLFLLAFSFNENVGPIGFLVFCLFTTGFYMQGEPKELIEIFSITPQKFIQRKIFIYWKYLSILAIPFVITTLVFTISLWYYMIGAVFISYLIAIITILIKYALFQENHDLNRNSMILILHIFFLIVPFFWPVTIFSGIRFYKKAITNLNCILHD